MKVDKKHLASRALNVGVGRILFNKERLAEINEAITKQDIRDLLKDGAIMIREVSARKTHVKRKQRRRQGSVKKHVSNGKRDYIRMVRGARRVIAHARMQETMTREQAILLRKEIKTGRFTTKAALRERMKEMQGQ